MTFEQLALAILSGSFGATVIIGAIRLLGPLATRFVGSVLRTRAELDADRDRIILNLRAEVDDHKRRLKDCEDGRQEVIERADELQQRVNDLESFRDEVLNRRRRPQPRPRPRTRKGPTTK